ncbi:MAG: hypothetical protein IKS48_09930 [Eubacterium sp.]|nr:hypothetical protein [Eubacterium sp.]
MREEIKIVLPPYKIIYSVLIVMFLPVLRGISDTNEIGCTMDVMMSALTMVMFADTYLVEKREQRWEIISLLPEKSRKRMVYMRFFIQLIYILFFSAAGYFTFFIWKPVTQDFHSELQKYFEYLLAVGISIVFWGILVLIIANVTSNIWKGIGTGLVLWLNLFSTLGNRTLGRYNVFAYVYAETDTGISGWIPGKIIGLMIAGVLGILILPKTLEFRRD